MRKLIALVLLVVLCGAAIPAAADPATDEVYCEIQENPRPDLDARNWQWEAWVWPGFTFATDLTYGHAIAVNQCRRAAEDFQPADGGTVVVIFPAGPFEE